MDIKTPEKLLEALTIEQSNLDAYKNALGFGETEITESAQDRANLSTALDNADIAEADKKTIIQIKNEVFDSNSQGTLSAYPAFAVTPLPFPAMKAGALTRYRNRKARAKLASGYTKQIGIALGYETAPAGSISNTDLLAAMKVSDSGGYQYRVEFKKQGKSGMLIQERLKGTEKWTREKIALTSPYTTGTEIPVQDGAAVQLELRCRLLDGNTPVGQWSPIYLLTVNP